MVGQLYFLIFIYLLGVSAGVYGAYVLCKRILPHNDSNLHRRLGRRNALALKHSMEEVCVFCDKPINPDKDLYEDKIGWHHSNCYMKLLNE